MAINKVKKIKNKKKPKSRTQKDCDRLLSPLIIKMFPRCLLCGRPTEVAHHHIHKSKSLVLRYNLKNLINLCGKCHLKLHWNESYWASKIVEINGLGWFKQLDREKNRIIKPNYNKSYQELKDYEKEL